MTEYVCGLLFSESRETVALVHKQKPAWQAGKLNGPGGKIERRETPPEAMAREFAKETGVEIAPEQWQPLAVLRGVDFTVHFFAAFDNMVFCCRTIEAEQIIVGSVAGALAGEALIPNLRVLIPLALDRSGIVKPVDMFDCVPKAA